MPVWTDPAKCESRLVLSLHRWWSAKDDPTYVPDRSELDPADLKALLPNILIAEAEHDPFRVKYRLSGTRVTEITGLDISADELARELARRRYGRAFADAAWNSTDPT